jgi:recombination protein RecA
MSDFNEIFKSLDKAAKTDPHANAHRSGDITMGSDVPYGIPSGLPRLDVSIGRPGLPAGKVIEYFGFEMSGKTTAAFHALAQAQRMGGGGLYIDGEYAWDEERAINVGIDPDVNFSVSEVETIEAIFRQIEAAIKGVQSSGLNKPFLIIVDSITGVTTELEKEKEYGAVSRIGEDARVIRNGMRKIVPEIAKSNVTVIFINHAVAKVAANPYAKQSQSSGGHAIKFFASLRCEFSNAGQLKEGDVRLGQKINIGIEKLRRSRLDHPRIKDLELRNADGFSLTPELLEAAKMVGLVNHPKGSKTYTLTHPEEMEFPKADWPAVIQNFGGDNKFYDLLLKWSLENGAIKPWGGVQFE